MSATREPSQYSLIKDMVKNHPIFSKLDENSLNELMHMTEVTHAYPHEPVVTEGDPIDCVYLIINGKAEVRTHANNNLPICILSDYDAIGLTATGLFSQSGMRTATVIALTKMTLLKIKLEYFYRLTERFSSTSAQKRKLSEQILRVQFLKQVIPFANLSREKLEWLTHRMEEMKLNAHEIVFQQDDDADMCYLIFSGEVEVSTQNQQGKPRRIAVLRAPMMFGETAPLLNKKRNATVRTLTECEFLILRRKDLLKLFQLDKEAAKILTSIIRQRIRPKRHEHVITYEHHNIDGVKNTIIKDPIKLNFYQLTEESKFIWRMLDGENSLYDISIAVYQQYKVFDPNMVCSMIIDLARAGFVDIPNYEWIEAKAHLPFWQRLRTSFHQASDAQFIFANADSWLTKSYKKVFHFFFNRLTYFVMLLFSIFGVIAFAVQAPTAIHNFHQIAHPWLFFIASLFLFIISLPIHELAHAFTTKYFKHHVSLFGIGLHWFFPMAFTNTTEMWTSERKPRLIVNFAGIFTDLTLSGIAALIAWSASGAGTVTFFWLFSLIMYISIFKNFNPIQEFDGYSVLSDSVNKVHWRESAFQWAVKNFPSHCFTQRAWEKYRAEALFWLFCIGYFFLMTYGVFFLQQVLFPALFPDTIAQFFTQSYRWLLPSVSLLLASIALWTKLSHTHNH